MTTGFRTVTQIHNREPLLRRMVCEVRYQDGQLYLDRCGRILKQLIAHAPEWILSTAPTPQGTSAFNLAAGTQLGLSMTSTSLSLDKTASDEIISPEEIAIFHDQIDSVMGPVLDELEVSVFARVGYREQHYFAFDSKEESEKWLRELGLATVAPEFYQVFDAQPEALGVALIIQGNECRYRIVINGTERAAQVPVGEGMLAVRASAVPKGQRQAVLSALKKQSQRQINSAFSVVLDIDAFLVDPPEVDLRGFVQQYSQENIKQFGNAIARSSPKKRK